MDKPPLVSVLFVTYRRVNLLRRAVYSLIENTDYANLELVVADDGSPPRAQKEIESLPFTRMIMSPRNRGLGANANAGLRNCKGKYILQLQDDWECRGPARYLRDAIGLMENRPEVGMVRFYGDPSADVSCRMNGASPECYWIPHRFCEIGSGPGAYSDTPHVKRRTLIDVIGEYRENCRMEECELNYGMRFVSQVVFRAVYFPIYYNTTFIHLGASNSFRTGSLLRRLEQGLSVPARLLKVRSPVLYKLSSSLYHAGVRSLFRLGALRH
jgi:glycosyltransferase involved in cell wall biosynthesis